jgi:hypothetical protein
LKDDVVDDSISDVGEWVIESVNTTCLKNLKARLLVTDAHVVIAQETGVTKVNVNDFVAWARNRGWVTSLACAAFAVPCDGGQTSAGALVLVRAMVGLGAVQAELLCDSVDGRLAVAVVQLPGFPQMVFGVCTSRLGLSFALSIAPSWPDGGGSLTAPG